MRAIDKKIPTQAGHAVNTSVTDKVVGTALTVPLIIAGSAGLFGIGVVTKATHHGIYAGVELYQKIRKSKPKPCDVRKAGQQISNSVLTPDKVLNPEGVQYICLENLLPMQITLKHSLCWHTRNMQVILELV